MRIFLIKNRANTRVERILAFAKLAFAVRKMGDFGVIFGDFELFSIISKLIHFLHKYHSLMSEKNPIGMG